MVEELLLLVEGLMKDKKISKFKLMPPSNFSLKQTEKR
jgi:hypothetical protein